MKKYLVGTIGAASIILGISAQADSPREITAAEVASFLGISLWETRVSLPPNSYSVDVCRLKAGKVGEGLFRDQIDWAKDPTGHLKVMAGPDGTNYKISLSTKTGGTLSVSTSAFELQNTYRPALPESIGEGVYILFVDLKDRKTDGPQDRVDTYQRGFVLKVTKKT